MLHNVKYRAFLLVGVLIMMLLSGHYSYSLALKTSYGAFKQNRADIKMILNLPLENRTHVFLKYDTNLLFYLLKKIALSDRESMHTRWNALISLAHSVEPYRARAVLRSLFSHPVWFVRNATLLAMEVVDTRLALQYADKLLDDPSLVVRTAAVDLIRRQKASRYKLRLIEKLNAKDSFYKNSSLWIRHHIASALADFAISGDKALFVSLLKDPDPRLHSIALSALKKINTQKGEGL